jgi:hypothetical protein
MIPLGFTSTKKSIARPGGKRWRLLHRVTYVGAIAAVVHYLWLVKADTRRPLIYAFPAVDSPGFSRASVTTIESSAWHAYWKHGFGLSSDVAVCGSAPIIMASIGIALAVRENMT